MDDRWCSESSILDQPLFLSVVVQITCIFYVIPLGRISVGSPITTPTMLIFVADSGGGGNLKLPL